MVIRACANCYVADNSREGIICGCVRGLLNEPICARRLTRGSIMGGLRRGDGTSFVRLYGKG